MYILGLSAFVKNPGACLLKDGKLVAFAEEERFLRIKGAHDVFPRGAVSYCLSQEKIALKDVKKIAVGWDSPKYKFKMPVFFLSSWLKYGVRNPSSGSPTVINELLTYNPNNFLHNIRLELSRLGRTTKIPPVEFIPHHLAHAASTFYASGFDRSAILVIDGSGEERTTSFFTGEGLEIKPETHFNIPDSLGWFYAAITAYLGFKPYEEEGHLMGLSPYGKPKKAILIKLRQVLSIKSKGKYEVDPKYTLLGLHSFNSYFSDQLVTLLGQPRFPGEPINQKHKDIAYAAQYLLEEAALNLAERATLISQTKKLCLAGGVTLNCKMNGAILATSTVDEIFVQPVGNDAGSSLGAAMIVAKDEGYDPRFKMDHAYWGPGFSQNEVKRILDLSSISYSRPKSIVEKAAEAIAKGRAVAWFDGRMEVGPRALGARSILASASKKGVKDYINNKIKHRETWRPFCPSLIEEVAPQYLEGISKSQKEARFMIVTYAVFKDKQKEISEVVHVDGTTRPQTVNKKINKKYYNLISLVGEKTGTPVILNTSFNVKGEPVIATPEQALRCFASTGLDALAVEGFWIEK